MHIPADHSTKAAALMYSPEQLAQLTGISRQTIYRHVKSGRLPATRLGGRLLIPAHAVRSILEPGSTTSGTRSVEP